MMTLSLSLLTAQADITAAFLHDNLPEGDNIYVHQAQGFLYDGNNG
jgi:ferredoxin-NADP reductase